MQAVQCTTTATQCVGRPLSAVTPVLGPAPIASSAASISRVGKSASESLSAVTCKCRSTKKNIEKSCNGNTNDNTKGVDVSR